MDLQYSLLLHTAFTCVDRKNEMKIKKLHFVIPSIYLLGRLYITNVQEQDRQGDKAYVCVATNYFMRRNTYDKANFIIPRGSKWINSHEMKFWKITGMVIAWENFDQIVFTIFFLYLPGFLCYTIRFLKATYFFFKYYTCSIFLFAQMLEVLFYKVFLFNLYHLRA